MLRILCAALWITCAFPVSAEQPTHEDLFQKGLAAYQNKQYAEARENFQSLRSSLLKDGQDNARVLHNLALTHYQLNNKPLALALWRKALTVDPSFSPARRGREFLETQLNARPWGQSGMTLWLRRALEGVSVYELLWALAVVLTVAGWLWMRYLADRRDALEDEKPLPPFPLSALAASVFLVCGLGLVTLKISYLLNSRATVIGEQVSVRSLPTEQGVALFELRGGSEVLVRRQNESWLQVQNSEGATGWVKDAEILITSER